MIELTAALQTDGENRVPPIKIFDQSNNQIKTVGRGSARLFSKPIEPTRLGSAWVFGIDMGVEPRRFTDAHGNFTLDTRRLTSFVRDISLISDDDYREIKQPSKLTKFPEDLANKNLEYSGIYEDGWMAESAVVRLAGPTRPVQFNVAGIMPWNPKTSGVSQIVVRIDGVEKARFSLTQGEFSIPMQIEPSDKPILVEIRADGARPLGPVDHRPASIRLTRIGWDAAEGPYPKEYKPSPDTAATMDSVGFWSDGWSATHSELTLASGTGGILAIRGMVPSLGNTFEAKLTVIINGTEIGTADVRPGEVTTRFPIPASAEPRRIVLNFSNGQHLPRPDTRRVGMLIDSISISLAQ
jgi:hypothetical protein